MRSRRHGDAGDGAGDIHRVARRAGRKGGDQGTWRDGQTLEIVIPSEGHPIHGHKVSFLTPIRGRHNDRDRCIGPRWPQCDRPTGRRLPIDADRGPGILHSRRHGDAGDGRRHIHGIAPRACSKRWGQEARRHAQTLKIIIPPEGRPIHRHDIGVLTSTYGRHDDWDGCARPRSPKRNGPGLARCSCLSIDRHARIGILRLRRHCNAANRGRHIDCIIGNIA